MSNRILLKRSGVANTAPSAASLEPGELAINYADGTLYFKNSSNNIIALASTKSANITGNITAGNVISLGTVSAAGNVSGNYFSGNGSTLSGINSFGIVAVSGQSDVTADNTNDTLTLAAGSGVVIATDPATGTVTIALTGGGSAIFQTGGDMGTVDEAVTASVDMGLVTVAADTLYDLGTLVTSGLIWPTELKLPEYTVSTLPSAGLAGLMIYVADAAGGSIPAFSDGVNWRRVDDRNIVT